MDYFNLPFQKDRVHHGRETMETGANFFNNFMTNCLQESSYGCNLYEVSIPSNNLQLFIQ